MYRVGTIFNTHGLKGDVKVKRISDIRERFDKGNELHYKDDKNKAQKLIISHSRTQKDTYILRFAGINHINDVLFLKGKSLYIKNEQLTELAEKEFYYHEIIGCRMYTSTGEEIGVVDAILSPGANDVWVVKDSSNKEHLIPYIDDVVKEVNLAKKKIIIELMEGLID